MRVAFRPDQAEARGSPEFGDCRSRDAGSLAVISFSSFVVKGKLFESFNAWLDRAGEFIPELDRTDEVAFAFSEPGGLVPGLARNRLRKPGGQAAFVQLASFGSLATASEELRNAIEFERRHLPVFRLCQDVKDAHSERRQSPQIHPVMLKNAADPVRGSRS